MTLDLLASPWVHFEKILSEAKTTISIDPNAVQLATVDRHNCPRLRTVLYKGMVRGGLSFYTNYNGAKAQDLKVNPNAAMLFYWRELSTQIRFEGVVDKLTDSESDSYFKSRPRLSQIGAWASEQSQPLVSTEVFQSRILKFEEKFKDLVEVPRPPHWGGFRLRPQVIEFWFGKEGRLHERFIYSRENVELEDWKTSMKFP